MLSLPDQATLVEASTFNGDGPIPLKVAVDLGNPSVPIAGVESELYFVVFGSPNFDVGFVEPEIFVLDSGR